MPTGYTDPVGKGELTDFSQFALMCSRAMGVAIMQRDESASVPLRIERHLDTHYRDTAEKYAAEVRELEEASVEALAARQQKSVDEENEYRSEHLRKAGLVADRYRAMLDQVHRWASPTPEHDNFKAFMVQQLEESIKFDGPFESDFLVAECVPVEEYRDQQLVTARRMRDIYEQHWRDEQERVESRAQWIEDFLTSLPDPDAHAKAVAAFEARNAAVHDDLEGRF